MTSVGSSALARATSVRCVSGVGARVVVGHLEVEPVPRAGQAAAEDRARQAAVRSGQGGEERVIGPARASWRGLVEVEQRVDRRGGDGRAALLAAVGHARQARGGQRRLGLGGADEADRQPDDQRRVARRALEQLEERGRARCRRPTPRPAAVSATARRIAAAVRVMPSLAASCAARGSSSGTVASRRVIPPATMRVSHTTGAPASSASRPARSASSSVEQRRRRTRGRPTHGRPARSPPARAAAGATGPRARAGSGSSRPRWGGRRGSCDAARRRRRRGRSPCTRRSPCSGRRG